MIATIDPSVDRAGTIAAAVYELLLGGGSVDGEEVIDLRIVCSHRGVQVEELSRDAASDGAALPLSLLKAPLTQAEQNVLRYFPTHLSFPEIGELSCISRHTVKSHAASIYRKLGVSSRGAAVEVAQRLGLLTRYVVLPETR